MSLLEQYFTHLCYLHDLAPWWWKIDFSPGTKYAVINVMEQQRAEDICDLCLRWAGRAFKCRNKYYITVRIKVNTNEDLRVQNVFFSCINALHILTDLRTRENSKWYFPGRNELKHNLNGSCSTIPDGRLSLSTKFHWNYAIEQSSTVGQILCHH